MWCASCQQDVPGLGRDEAGQYECPRCGEVLCNRMEGLSLAANGVACSSDDSCPTLSEGEPIRLRSAPSPPVVDTWELDFQLRRAARLLGLPEPEGSADPRARFDPAHPAVLGWHRGVQVEPSGPGKAIPSRSGGVLGGVLTWVGTAVCSCGGMLLGWALLGLRSELQAPGLLILAAGLLALCVAAAVRLGPIPGGNIPPSCPTARQDSRLGQAHNALAEHQAASAI